VAANASGKKGPVDRMRGACIREHSHEQIRIGGSSQYQSARDFLGRCKWGLGVGVGTSDKRDCDQDKGVLCSQWRYAPIGRRRGKAKEENRNDPDEVQKVSAIRLAEGAVQGLKAIKRGRARERGGLRKWSLLCPL